MLKARELGLAGVTVLRRPMGFGANSPLHTAKMLRLSMDLPVVIDIVDCLISMKWCSKDRSRLNTFRR